jgi:hypothetical protein
MSATDAIEVARHAGIKLTIDGDDLVLEAPAPPPATVLDLLSRHKAEVVAILAATAHDNKLLARTPISESVTDSAEGEPGHEQPCASRRGRVEELDGVFLHFCVECGRFGPFGYGVCLRAGQLGRWYCREHRPQGTNTRERSVLHTPVGHALQGVMSS